VASIEQLVEQIKTLEAVDRDSTTPLEVKSVNRDFLRERRFHLRNLYSVRISALRKYQASVALSLTSNELKVLEAAIRQSEKGLQDLEIAVQEGTSGVALVSQPLLTSSTPKIASHALADRVSHSSATTNSVDGPFGPLNRRPMAVANGCYANVPTIISTEVDRIATDISNSTGTARDAAEKVGNVFGTLFTLTVSDAFSFKSEEVNLRQLAAYQYIGETARTDKQVGASARAAGSTSAAEKPGWADIIGLAVEHGAIQQEVSGTTLTLSTTPYAFVVPTERDTAKAYRSYGNLRRVAMSATFNISDEISPLSNASRKNLSEYSVKIRLTPDRSPRSSDFRERWKTDIKPTIQNDLNLFSGIISAVLNQPGVRDYRNDVMLGLIDEIETELTNNHPTRTTPEQKAAAKAVVKEKILCALDTRVFNEVQTTETGNGKIKIDVATRERLLNDFIPALFTAQEERKRASEAVQKIFDDLDKKPFATFAYTNQRAAAGSDYSVFKMLYQQYLGDSPVKMILNAGVSAYHKPDAALNQEKFRDFAAAMSFEGKRKSPFISLDSLDLSPMTYSLTGRYERLQENKGIANKKADIGVVQFKLDIPISKGLSVPLSLTYANATEEQKEKHVRGNFGLTFDFDKFLLLRKLLEQ